ncbi:hypothetical protein Q1695_004029 [Nippostrongylus brasiliensis]|nr:hypothetical protein Q1695_004029 [Nippostrongylus brasiliensis]
MGSVLIVLIILLRSEVVWSALCLVADSKFGRGCVPMFGSNSFSSRSSYYYSSPYTYGYNTAPYNYNYNYAAYPAVSYRQPQPSYNSYPQAYGYNYAQGYSPYSYYYGQQYQPYMRSYNYNYNYYNRSPQGSYSYG